MLGLEANRVQHVPYKGIRLDLQLFATTATPIPLTYGPYKAEMPLGECRNTNQCYRQLSQRLRITVETQI